MFERNRHVVFILLFLISCTQAEFENTQLTAFEFPTIIDTASVSPLEMRKTWLNTANYQIYYIGPINDTLLIDYYFNWYLRPVVEPASQYYSKILNDTIRFEEQFYQERVPYQDYFIDWMDNGPTSISYKKAKLNLFVDTAKHVLNEEFDAYPVIVRNADSDTVRIAYGDFIPIIMEARDKNGFWKEIEEPWRYMCGTGVGTIVLPPNEILLTSAYCYNGPMKTQMRLKLGANYSSPFFGGIHPRQFESIFNEHGEYRSEASSGEIR